MHIFPTYQKIKAVQLTHYFWLVWNTKTNKLDLTNLYLLAFLTIVIYIQQKLSFKNKLNQFSEQHFTYIVTFTLVFWSDNKDKLYCLRNKCKLPINAHFIVEEARLTYQPGWFYAWWKCGSVNLYFANCKPFLKHWQLQIQTHNTKCYCINHDYTSKQFTLLCNLKQISYYAGL